MNYVGIYLYLLMLLVCLVAVKPWKNEKKVSEFLLILIWPISFPVMLIKELK